MVYSTTSLVNNAMKKKNGIVTVFFNAIASEELRNSGLNEIGTLTSAIPVKSP